MRRNLYTYIARVRILLVPACFRWMNTLHTNTPYIQSASINQSINSLLENRQTAVKTV